MSTLETKQIDKNSLGRSVQEMVESWYRYLKRNKDLFILVSGDVGAGKSNFTMGLCDWHICPTVGVPYDYNTMMYLDTGTERLKSLFFDNPRYTPIQVDEAVKDFLNLHWWQDTAIEMQQTATQSRVGNKIVFLLIPDKKQLQSYFRNSRVTYWIHIWKEGLATVFGKSLNIFAHNRWYEEYGEKLFRKNKVNSVSKAMRIASRHPCFITNLRYKKYTGRLWDKYERDAAKAKAESAKQEQEKGMSLSQWKRNRAMEIYDELDKAYIAKVLGVTTRTLYRWRKKHLKTKNTLNVV